MLTPDFTDMQPILPDTLLYETYGRSLFNYFSSSLGIPRDMMNSTNGTNYSSSMASMKAMIAMLPPKPDPMALNGKIVVDRWICTPPTFVRWKRKHRKSRINKKWQKRYGAVMQPCKGVSYNMSGTILVCPCMVETIKLAIGTE